MPEALLWLLLTGEVPTKSQVPIALFFSVSMITWCVLYAKCPDLAEHDTNLGAS